MPASFSPESRTSFGPFEQKLRASFIGDQLGDSVIGDDAGKERELPGNLKRTIQPDE
jgi:hypothetical protein